MSNTKTTTARPTETAKQKLANTVTEYMSEEQAHFLNNLIQATSRSAMSKGDLMDQAEMLGTGNVDASLPYQYVNRVQEILPSFNTSFAVMDYRENSHGEIKNIAEVIILRMNEIMKH